MQRLGESSTALFLKLDTDQAAEKSQVSCLIYNMGYIAEVHVQPAGVFLVPRGDNKPVWGVSLEGAPVAEQLAKLLRHAGTERTVSKAAARDVLCDAQILHTRVRGHTSGDS